MIIIVLQGKNESLRARAILRSLVPLDDLKGALSLRFTLQNKSDESKSDMPPGKNFRQHFMLLSFD